VANQLQAHDLVEVVGFEPIVRNVDYFTLFNKPPVNGRIEFLRLIGGGNQEAVATAVDDFIQYDV
jgi:hypothetical protein